MAIDPITGPLSRTEFAELVSAPHGEAKKVIRKYDPYYRLEPGEKIRFVVEARGRLVGRAFVQANSQAEADKLADALCDADFDWHSSDNSFDIISVEVDTL